MTNNQERRHSKSPSLFVPPSPQVPLSTVTPHTQSVAENGHYIIVVDLLLPPLPILFTAAGWGSLTIGTLVEKFILLTTYLDEFAASTTHVLGFLRVPVTANKKLKGKK